MIKSIDRQGTTFGRKGMVWFWGARRAKADVQGQPSAPNEWQKLRGGVCHYVQ